MQKFQRPKATAFACNMCVFESQTRAITHIAYILLHAVVTDTLRIDAEQPTCIRMQLQGERKEHCTGCHNCCRATK